MKNTKIVIGLALILVVVYLGFLATQGKKTEETSVVPTPTEVTEKTYTLAEVEKHVTESDCWTVINEDIYDVTGLISKHPGGRDAILSACGKDGTSIFEERNGKGPHPDKAQDVLSGIRVGKLSSI